MGCADTRMVLEISGTAEASVAKMQCVRSQWQERRSETDQTARRDGGFALRGVRTATGHTRLTQLLKRGDVG